MVLLLWYSHWMPWVVQSSGLAPVRKWLKGRGGLEDLESAAARLFWRAEDRLVGIDHDLVDVRRGSEVEQGLGAVGQHFAQKYQ